MDFEKEAGDACIMVWIKLPFEMELEIQNKFSKSAK